MNKMNKNAMVEHLTLPDGIPFDMCIERIWESYENIRSERRWGGNREQWGIWSKFLMDKYAPGLHPGRAMSDKIRMAIRAADEVPYYDFRDSMIKFMPNPFKPKPKKEAVFNLHEKRKAQGKKQGL